MALLQSSARTALPVDGAASGSLPAEGAAAGRGWRGIQIDRAVAALDAWFNTMRGDGGYGGPVVHWWQQSFIYTGAGLDWRYEGIIIGYLWLWQRTSDARWLEKACRAGDDLVAGQLSSGHFRGSAFEINPAAGGTPHEAACDAALLALAHTLRSEHLPAWERYADCAERNLRAYYINQLWDPVMHSFRDGTDAPSFVPNKAATTCDALFLLAGLREDDVWIEQHVLPTLDRILHYQVSRGPLDGAIAQNSYGGRLVEKYFPIYIARCVPALLSGYGWTERDVFLDAAIRAMGFVVDNMDDDGALPTVVYPNRRASKGPVWISPLGDVLRAVDAVRPFGFAADVSPMHERLIAGQDASGGIQTATEFARQAGGRRQALPDVRDVMHVAGWCDKAFRYLAAHAGPVIPEERSNAMEADCTFRGQEMVFRETPDEVAISRHGETRYRWLKGSDWPQWASPEFWLR